MTVDHHDWELWERYFKALGFNFQSFVWKRYGCFLDQPNAFCIRMCKGYDLIILTIYWQYKSISLFTKIYNVQIIYRYYCNTTVI